MLLTYYFILKKYLKTTIFEAYSLIPTPFRTALVWKIVCKIEPMSAYRTILIHTMLPKSTAGSLIFGVISVKNF